MKFQKTALIVMVLLVLVLLPTVALAEDTTPADGYNDYDYNAIRTFLEYESGGVKNGDRINPTDYDADDPGTWTGVIFNSASERRLTNVEWSDFSVAGALDLTGCTSLTKVICHNSELASLNVSGLTSLTELFCDENQLTSLNVSGCTALQMFNCEDNQLTSLSVTGCPNLVRLICSTNQLGTLNASGLEHLEMLECQNNVLTSLNVTGCSIANNINCSQNQLTALDLTGCTALCNLTCTNNQLTSLDVSPCTILETFSCDINAITALDVDGYTHLYAFSCSGNQLTALDLTGCSQLSMLKCDNNSIASLDMSGCASMTYIESADNPLTSIRAIVGGANVSLTAEGLGYVSLFYNGSFSATATTAPHGIFFYWTDAAGNQVSMDTAYTLTPGTGYALTANFTPILALSPSVQSGSVYTGGRITLTPNVSGGTWSFDSAYLSRDGNTFTALKAGTLAVTYTVDGQSASYTVTITAAALPETGQDFTWAWALGGAAALAAGAILIIFRKKEAKA